jgi:hypothetical protein
MSDHPATLTLAEIAALARTGATLREVSAVLGRKPTAAERSAYDRAKLSAKVAAKVRRGKAGTMDTEAAQAERERNRGHARRHAARVRSADLAVTIPPVADPDRRARCAASLAAFLETYFAPEFPHPFDPAMAEVIALVERVATEGGRFVAVMPRGSGKTVVLARAALWSALTGRRPFAVLIGATQPDAARLLNMLAVDLQCNELLRADWPEVCSPFAAGEGKPQRLRALHADGETLHCNATADRLLFPTWNGRPDSAAQGQIVACRGLTGSIRGLNHTGRDGRTVRPSLVLVDDPQSDESARSEGQTRERESLLAGAVLGLAGPGEKLSCLVAATCIRKNDLAARLLDKRRHPEFEGRRFPLVKAWPTSTLWADYDRLWRENGPDAASGFYAAHREAMDQGADVPCSWRIRPGELSAIETAHALRLELGEAAFAAEYQGEPRAEHAARYDLDPAEVAAHVHPFARGVVPPDAPLLVVGADVNLYGISWAGLALSDRAAGFIVDYGKTGPLWEKGAAYSEEQGIHAGILAFVARVLANRYATPGGERITPAAIVIDCSFRRDVVIAACRQARAKAGAVQVIPVRGVSSRAYRPMNARRRGDHWHVGQFGPSGNALFLDVDTWRERMQRAWIMPPAAPGGSLALYSGAKDGHREIADQVCAETLTDVLQGQRMENVYVWQLRPGGKNDLPDALTYAIGAAAHLGIRWGEPMRTGARRDRGRNADPSGMDTDTGGAPEKPADPGRKPPRPDPPAVRDPVLQSLLAARRGRPWVSGWRT